MPPKGYKKSKPAPAPPPKEPPKAPAKAPDPEPEPEPSPDDDAEFVTDKDVKALRGISPAVESDKIPGQPGFIADIVEGLLWKVDDVEYGITGHRVFIRSEADAKIERGIARYVESVIDPAKYGVIVLLAAYAGSQSLKWAIYGADRAASQKAERDKITGKGKK